MKSGTRTRNIKRTMDTGIYQQGFSWRVGSETYECMYACLRCTIWSKRWVVRRFTRVCNSTEHAHSITYQFLRKEKDVPSKIRATMAARFRRLTVPNLRKPATDLLHQPSLEKNYGVVEDIVHCPCGEGYLPVSVQVIGLFTGLHVSGSL